MGRPRIRLHYILREMAPHVYYQPPNGLKMQYPCIIYRREAIDIDYADNSVYDHTNRYSVTVVDADPDSPLIDDILSLPMCSFDRFYTSENLNHNVFNLYF